MEGALSLLFAPGERPGPAQLEDLFGGSAAGSVPARISACAEGDGWLELLASGLTFEVSGLAPAAPFPTYRPERFFGLPADMFRFEMEAVALSPGPHIAAGRAMLPVVRTQLAIAANVVLHLPVKVVCWHPARSWMDARYFARQTLTWLSGGAFPALGLTGLDRRDDGLFFSTGLAFFAGQELVLHPARAEPPAETVKLGVRVIDHILRNGPIAHTQSLPGPAGEGLTLEVSGDRRQVRVKRAT